MSREFPKNPEPKITPPTVGRIVLLRDRDFPDTPLPMLVSYVEGYTINGTAFTTGGQTRAVLAVPHVSMNHLNRDVVWDWMDYQKGQAAKTDELAERIEQMKAGHDKK